MIHPGSSDKDLRRLVKQVAPDLQDLHLQKLRQFREQAKAFAKTPIEEADREKTNDQTAQGHTQHD